MTCKDRQEALRSKEGYNNWLKNHKAGIKKWNDQNPENRKARQKKSKKLSRLLHRLQILDHYSEGEFCCNVCGENRHACLTIDHIYGGGTKHRKDLRKSGIEFYTWLMKNDFPPGFRVLCMNCQFCEETAPDEERQEVYYHTRR